MYDRPHITSLKAMIALDQDIINNFMMIMVQKGNFTKTPGDGCGLKWNGSVQAYHLLPRSEWEHSGGRSSGLSGRGASEVRSYAERGNDLKLSLREHSLTAPQPVNREKLER